MNEEDALAALADALQREERLRPPEWDKVAHGRMSVEDAVAARRAAGDDEDDIARAREMFAPMDEAQEDALAERLAAIATESTPMPVEDEVDRPVPATVVRPDPGVWQRRVAYGVLAVAAAGVLVWSLRPPPDPDPAPQIAAATPLPSYEAVVQPGQAHARAGTDDGEVRLAVGAPFSVLLRPASRHEQPARTVLCLRDATGRTRRLDATQTPGGPGETLEVAASVPSDVEVGRWTLLAIVSAGDFGDAPCAARDADATKVVQTPVEIVRSSR